MAEELPHETRVLGWLAAQLVDAQIQEMQDLEAELAKHDPCPTLTVSEVEGGDIQIVDPHETLNDDERIALLVRGLFTELMEQHEERTVEFEADDGDEDA